MARAYWPIWKNHLIRWGLVSSASELIELTQSLLPLAAQVMFLGLPLIKSTALGVPYSALLDTLGDVGELKQFVTYLQEAET